MTRIPESRLTHDALSHAARNLTRLAEAQRRVATGRKIHRPSDDPLVLARALALHSDLRRVEAYSENASAATAFMSLTEGSLGEVSDLISRAKELLLEAINAPSEGIAAEAEATELRAMVESLFLVANREVAGRHLFGGQETLARPYVRSGGKILDRGDAKDLLEELGKGLRVATNLNGPQVFQTVPARIEGLDADPAVSGITRLSDLLRGAGVTPGRIRLTDSNGVTADVDLLGATRLKDVIDAVNASGTAIVASISADGKGIVLEDTAGGASFGVEDLAGSELAKGLGIATTSGTGTIESRDLDPVLSEDTPVAVLLGGAGLPPGAWRLRSDGPAGTREAVIDPTGVNTVGELLALVRDARDPDGTPLGIWASIEDGKIVLESLEPQTDISVVDVSTGGGAGALGLAAVGEARDVFTLLEEAASAVEARDVSKMDSLLRDFTVAIERTASLRGTYGARTRQVLTLGENLRDQTIDLELRLSDVEDADLARATIELARSETIYTASLQTSTRLLDLNLFNFIR